MTTALYLIKNLTFACGLRSIVADELSWGGENVSRNWRKWCQPISQVFLMKPVWTGSVFKECVCVCVCVCTCVHILCVFFLPDSSPAVFCILLAFLKDEVTPEQMWVLCYIQIVP